jgi:hypothetical protein
MGGSRWYIILPNSFLKSKQTKLKLNSVARVYEWTIPTKQPPLVGEVSANFWRGEGARVSVTDPYVHILRFLDQSRYVSFQLAHEL